MAADTGEKRLSLWRLLVYGLPALPLAAMLFPVYIYLPTFYAREIGMGLSVVFAVLVVARFWDVITDPIIGLLSDRTRSRFGRRKPWILAGLPVVTISAWMLFRPPVEADWAYLALWSALGYLGWTMMLLPLAAMGAELSLNYHERSRIAACREAFVVLGTVTAAGLPALFGGGPGSETDASAAGAALEALAWGLAVGLPVITVLLLVVVPEPRYAIKHDADWRRGVRVIAGNQPFRVLIVAYLLNGIANGLPATLFLFYVSSVLGQPGWVGPLLLTYFGFGVGSVPVWLLVSRRYGKHRTWCGAMVWACAFFALVPLLGQGDAWGFLAICVLTGISLGADMILPTSMQADVIDSDAVATGERRAGVYFALWGMATKIALALALVAFPILELAGFDSQAGPENSGGALFTLAALYAWLPVAFKLAAVKLMWGFPLGQKEQEALRARMGEGAVPEMAVD